MHSCTNKTQAERNTLLQEKNSPKEKKKKHLSKKIPLISDRLTSQKEKSLRLNLTIPSSPLEEDNWWVNNRKVRRYWKINIKDRRELFCSPRELKKPSYPKDFERFIECYHNNF